jgi:hypothetical protein
MELSKAKEILNSYDFDEISEFANGEMQQAVNVVLKELNNSISKNLIKDELIKIKDYSECKYCNNTCKNYNKCMYFQQMLEVFD